MSNYILGPDADLDLMISGDFEGFRHQAEKRLRVLEAAASLWDLRQLPV